MMNSNKNQGKKAFETPMLVLLPLDDVNIMNGSGEKPEEWYPGQEENEGIII